MHLTSLRALAAVREHPRLSAASMLALASAAALTVVLTSSSRQAPGFDPRTRVYTNQTACLLTDAHGTTTAMAGAAWAGMQQASKTNSERTSTLPITGAQTLQNAETYLNTLVLQGCQTVIGAGILPDQAIQARAAAFSRTRFISINGAATSQPAANLTRLPDGPPEAVSTDVKNALLADTAQRRP